MNFQTFESIVRDAFRQLDDVEDVLRSAWCGDGPNDAQTDLLEDVRGHLAAAKQALAKMGTVRAMSEEHGGPASHERATAEESEFLVQMARAQHSRLRQ